MGDVLEVVADLVMAPGQRVGAEERVAAAEHLERLHLGAGGPPRLALGHRSVDAELLVDRPPAEAEVGLAHPLLAKLRPEEGRHLEAPGEEQHARGLAIQTGWMAHCLEYLPEGAMIEPGAVFVSGTEKR